MAEAKTVNVAAAILPLVELMRIMLVSGSFLAEKLRLEKPQSRHCVEKFRKSCTVACRQRFSMTR